MRRLACAVWFIACAAAPAGCGSSTPVTTDGAAGKTAATGSAGVAGGSTSTGGGGGGGGQTNIGEPDGGSQTCTQSADCRHNGVCDTATHTCVECLASSDCGMQKCDTQTHTCVDCLVSADCPMSAPSCSTGHTCGQMCTKNADCPMGQPACQTSTHSCVECLVNGDCGPGGVCQSDLTCQ
jgi:hypothetical protein